MNYGENTPFYNNYAFRRVFVHPGFKEPETYYDIAIIELSKRIDFNFSYQDLSEITRFIASPLCLPNHVMVSKIANVTLVQ